MTVDAETNEHDSTEAQIDAASNSRYPIRKLIILLLIIEGLALSIKFIDERRSDNRSAKALIQRETLAVSEHVNGEIKAARAALKVAAQSGLDVDRLNNRFPSIDLLVTLGNAATATDDRRLQLAADRASDLISAGSDFGVTREGDIIIVEENPSGGHLLALTKGTNWLPIAEQGLRYTIRARSIINSGDDSLAGAIQATQRGQPRLAFGPGFARVTSYCTAIGNSGVSLCSARTTPLVSLSELGGLIMFGLLIAAPALAMFGLFGVMRIQVDQMREAEESKEDTTKIIDLVMDGARAGYWEWEPGAEDIFVSTHMSKLLESPVHGIVSLDQFLVAIHPGDRDDIRDSFGAGAENGALQVQFRTSYSQGRRWVELKGRMAERNDGSVLFTGICNNITERKKAEHSQRAAERRLRSAIDGYSGPFAIWDKRKRLLYWNAAFARTFNLKGALRPGMGYDAVNMAKAPAIKRVSPAEDDVNAQLTAMNDGNWLKMVERSTPEGGLITVGVDITDTMNSQEQLKRQRTKLKKLVAQLERSEGRAGELARKYAEEKAKAEHAANAKGTFLANMSHELRTPLNAINGFSEILVNELYGPHTDPKYKGYAQDILTSGQHLLDMINDILDMAKIEAGKMTISPQKIDPIDPVDAAVRMIKRRAEDKGITLELTHDPQIPDIEADPRAIRQMVLNLVSNAIKFTDAGGTITVQMQMRRDELRVAVIDTGVGIPPEDLPRLARPFEQVRETKDRNTNGTGLGLALTKSFAEMHGGRMTITSEYGKGTTVSFFLPVEAMQQAEDTPPMASNA